jgi:hypothetical protein
VKGESLATYGPGSKTIGVLECHVLLALRSEEPSRSLSNYCQNLLAYKKRNLGVYDKSVIFRGLPS